MKKLILGLMALVLSYTSFSQTITLTPNPFSESQEITITVSNFDPQSAWGVDEIYLWAWYFDANGDFGGNSLQTGNDFNNSPDSALFTDNQDGTYSYSFTPTTFYDATNISRIGFLVKSQDGTNQTQDFLFDVGTFQLTLNSPSEEVTILDSGETLSIDATTTEAGDFTLLANGIEIDNIVNSTSYINDIVINENTQFELQATNGTDFESMTFEVIVRPDVIEASLPNGLLDGINLDPNDNTKATLVLFAPQKDFVHVIGDFTNWQVNDQYLMNKDSSQDRFWVELTGLTPQFNHMYQYLVDGIINVADPYSTTILSEFNDQFIEPETYPNLPEYPTGLTTQAVTLLRVGDPEFQWQATDFVKPERTDLVIYELLVRDFDQRHSFNAVIERLDYLATLGINAIELMPVSEFDGNISWGYNPSFHMALDKYYGTPTAFKEFVDACHARGIAVILDVVFNHATGQFPYFRLYNDSNGGFNGQPTPDSPFFNQQATHSFSVFNDFNHSLQATRDYVERVSQFWISEYQVDGFRWDLTKGFTQNCSSGDVNCTNGFQQDRVDVLQLYADFQWEIDPDFYVMFEHLGSGGSRDEEIVWTNYRLDEGKGIMFWNNFNFQYNEATLGFHNNNQSNFEGIDYKNIGIPVPANVSYMESHDEERLMYRNFQFGNSNGDYNIRGFNTGLDRSELAGAFFFTVPGPKLLWQYGEVGYDFPINLCEDGSINEDCRTNPKPIRLDFLDDSNRFDIYESWRDLITLKLGEPIFRTSDFTIDAGNSNGLKRIHLSLNNATEGEIGFVTIIGNFGVTTQEINPEFQEVGIWYEFLNENLKLSVTNTDTPITLLPGEYRIYGNNPSSLFPDGNPPDQDNDGVLDGQDLCPDTPFGRLVDEDGCEITELPPDNFTIQTVSESCSTSNDGSISITATLELGYTVEITNENNVIVEDFNTNYELNSLTAGEYTICISTPMIPDYEQCFSVIITEPNDLNVFSSIDENNNILFLSLNGSDIYNITLNGELTVTSSDNIELELNDGVNTLIVEGEFLCQGIYEEEFNILNEIRFFPNPTRGSFNISQSLNFIEIYDITGKLVKIFSNDLIRTTLFDISDLQQGIYLIRYQNLNNEISTSRLIKY